MADQELARDLGFLEAYTLGLGTMIGAGIFVLPGIVAEAAGPASMVSFVVGGMVALLAALSLSELATGMPRAGGSYYYVNHALGSFFGTIVGWGMWTGLLFATAFYMLGFGQYLLHSPSGAIGVVLAALIMSSLLVALNYRGVKETGSLQNVTVVALVGVIIAFIAVGLPRVDPALLDPFVREGESWPIVITTAGTVFVTFIGFEVIATSAEEIKDPGRNLPLSMIAAVVTPTILYVLVMLVSTGLLPVPELAASDVPVADVAAVAAGAFGALTVAGITVEFATVGAVVMILGAILATVSSANASILSAARVNFAMGRDRILTDWLNKIHGRYRTPYRAIVATGLIVLLLIAGPFPLAFLAEVAAFMFLLTYALVHVAVVVLRRADPDEYDPDFRIPAGFYPAVPTLGFLSCLGVMAQMGEEDVVFTIPLGSITGAVPLGSIPGADAAFFGPGTVPAAVDVSLAPLSWVQLTGLVIVLLATVWHVYYAKERAISTTLIGEAVAPPEPKDDDVYRVVVPIANPETQHTLIRYAAASAAGHEGEVELLAVNVIEVPPQTSPAQVEEERVERQRVLLANARDIAADLGVGLRTRALVGRNASNILLRVLDEEDADHVLLGWAGPRKRRDVIFGTTIDPILERASCEVTLVKDPREDVESIVTLAGTGRNAPIAAERASELARAFPDAKLTLLNVQPPAEPTVGDESETADPEIAGRETIIDVAEAAGLSEAEFDPRVLLDEDVRGTLLEAVSGYDVVCVGATGQSMVAQALFGSIPRDIVRVSEGTVVMARDESRVPRTLRDAIIQRLGGRT